METWIQEEAIFMVSAYNCGSGSAIKHIKNSSSRGSDSGITIVTLAVLEGM